MPVDDHGEEYIEFVISPFILTLEDIMKMFKISKEDAQRVQQIEEELCPQSHR